MAPAGAAGSAEGEDAPVAEGGESDDGDEPDRSPAETEADQLLNEQYERLLDDAYDDLLRTQVPQWLVELERGRSG